MSEKKSTFVNVLGWILIIISGFSLLISIIENIMVNTVMPEFEMPDPIPTNNITDSLSVYKTFESIEISNELGDFPFFLFSNIKLIVALFGLLILTSFIISIAFLKRKNWGRLGLIILFLIGIAYSIAGLIFQWIFIESIDDGFPHFYNIFGEMMLLMKIFTAVIAIGLSVLFGWIIKKLTSKEIKDEV